MGERTDTAEGTASLQREARRFAHSWYQYGALGLLVLFFLGVGIYILHVFVPIFVKRFEVDEAQKVLQTAAMQQMAGAMEAIKVELHNEQEACRAAISTGCARRK